MDALWWITVAVCVVMVPVVVLALFVVHIFRDVETRALFRGAARLVPRLLLPLAALGPVVPLVLLRGDVFDHISVPVAVLLCQLWLCLVYLAYARVLDRPSAIWEGGDKIRAEGKTILITGGNSGLGFDAAVVLARRGASVVLACRSEARGQAAVQKVNAACKRDAASFIPCDLNSFASVRECARLFLATHNQLHVLINNGGFSPVAGRRTVEGFECGLGAMHFGHFLLTSLLEPVMRQTGTAADPARVVYTASQGHVKGTFHDSLYEGDGEGDLRGEHTEGVMSYMRCKLANILHAMELAKRWRQAGVRNIVAHSCHPGAVATNIWTTLPAAAAFIMHNIARHFMRSSPAGSLVLVGLAIDPKWGKTSGMYADAFVKMGPPKTPLSRDERTWAALWAASEVACGLVPKGNNHVARALRALPSTTPATTPAPKASPRTPLVAETK